MHDPLVSSVRSIRLPSPGGCYISQKEITETIGALIERYTRKGAANVPASAVAEEIREALAALFSESLYGPGVLEVPPEFMSLAKPYIRNLLRLQNE